LRRLSYSLSDAARAINQAAKDAEGVAVTYGPSTVHKWIRGVIPHPEARRWIAVGLDIPLERLSEAVGAVEAQRGLQAQSSSPQAGSVLVPYADASGATITSPDDELVSIVVRRRDFLAAMGGAAASVAASRAQPATAATSVAHNAPTHPAIAELTRLFFGQGERDPRVIDLGELGSRVSDAWQLWTRDRARYTATASALPRLMLDVQRAIKGFKTPQEASQRLRAYEIAAHHYFLLRSFFRAVGRYDLATLAADRAMVAAEATDDPILISAATWNLATVLLIDSQPQLAEEVAIEAARTIAPFTVDNSHATMVYGALHLTAASAAARRHEGLQTARDYVWNHAAPAAQVTGETNMLWTVCGPQNVHVIAIGVEMQGGNSSDALRLADKVDAGKLGSVERRATYLLEVARCYEQRQEDTGALHYLMRAGAEAPEDARYHPLATPMVRALLLRARPSLRPDVEALAKSVGVHDD